MYYEERVINGVLCYRTSPDGAWRQFSQKELTATVVKLTELLDEQSTELANVLEVAIARGEQLGYSDDDYRERLAALQKYGRT